MPRRGGLIGLVGQGVGMASEYREHRKQQKVSRENSQQNDAAIAGPSNLEASSVPPNTAPPAYTDVVDDKKAAQAQYDAKSITTLDDDDDDDLSSIEDDEEDWQLDEALERSDSELPTYNESEREYLPVDTLVDTVMSKNRAAITGAPTLVRAPLPCPVIIPQRRPRKKVRGFVRAYAPLLDECSGIDQATFLSFLENFYESSKASSIFPVIQVAAAIAGFAPSVIAMAVTTVVQIAAQTGQEIQTRHRTNDFLDKMNEQLFKPAGLYAMIVKYKSTNEVMQSGNSLLAKFGVSGEIVDLNTTQAVAKYDRPLSEEPSSNGGMSDRLKNIRLASGKTSGAVRLPEAAPLVFPDVDAALVRDGPETFKDKSKDAKAFLQDYMDRRAQISYARDDPNSALNVPESQRGFKSKYSDPDHPMFNNGLVGLASGGTLAPRQRRRQQRAERRAFRNDQPAYGRGYGGRRRRGGLISGLINAAVDSRQGSKDARSREYEDSYGMSHSEQKATRRSFDDRTNASAPYAEYGGRNGHASYGGASDYSHLHSQSRRPKGPIGLVRRVMREDVLYLMIVNMPSEAELADARDALARAKSVK